MATQKPISTISYNTESFLREKLEEWYNAHIIQSYMYICHKGEDGDKDHIHLRIEPNKRIDPMELTEELKEYVPGNKKPLGIRPWRPSKEEDWILYIVHDKDYLKMKYGGGEKGEKLPYKWEDIKANEYYDTEIAYIRARSAMDHTTANMAKSIEQGQNPLGLILQGENVYTVNAIVRALNADKTKYIMLRDANMLLNHNMAILLKFLKNLNFKVEYDSIGEIESIREIDDKSIE